MTPDASQQWTLTNTLKAPLCAAAPVSSRVLKYARKRSHEGTSIFYGIPDKNLFGLPLCRCSEGTFSGCGFTALILYHLNPPVLSLALFRTIVGDRLLLAPADCGHSVRGDALLDDRAHD